MLNNVYCKLKLAIPVEQHYTDFKFVSLLLPAELSVQQLPNSHSPATVMMPY